MIMDVGVKQITINVRFFFVSFVVVLQL